MPSEMELDVADNRWSVLTRIPHEWRPAMEEAAGDQPVSTWVRSLIAQSIKRVWVDQRGSYDRIDQMSDRNRRREMRRRKQAEYSRRHRAKRKKKHGIKPVISPLAGIEFRPDGVATHPDLDALGLEVGHVLGAEYVHQTGRWTRAAVIDELGKRADLPAIWENLRKRLERG